MKSLWMLGLVGALALVGCGSVVADTSVESDMIETGSILAVLGPDQKAPVVSISTPTAGSVSSKAAVTVSGVASDNVSVTKIVYVLNGARAVSFGIAAGSSVKYSASVKNLRLGSNKVVVRAYDAAGNRSATNVVFEYSTSATTTTPTPAPTPVPAPTPTPTPVAGKINLPPTGKVQWDWQIGASNDSAITLPTGVKILDVDGFNASASKVASLKAAGVYTVCYLDVGSYEDGRPDSAQYPDSLKIYYDSAWGEWFLDVTDVFKTNSVLAKILRARFQMCKDKGFDAVEPDNLQNDENAGGKITLQQQLDFNGWIADTVHEYGLAVFQKNGPDKILGKDRTGKMMVDKFDAILNEECQQYNECAPLAEYTKRGKLALNTEYAVNPDCALSDKLAINTIRKDLNLTGGTASGYKRVVCP